jgi:hypothetical protein
LGLRLGLTRATEDRGRHDEELRQSRLVGRIRVVPRAFPATPIPAIIERLPEDRYWTPGVRLALSDEAALNVPLAEPVPSTGLVVVSRLQESERVPQGALVGILTVETVEKGAEVFHLKAGIDTAETLLGPKHAHSEATVIHEQPLVATREAPAVRKFYVARFSFPEPRTVMAVTVAHSGETGMLLLDGLFLQRP